MDTTLLRELFLLTAKPFLYVINVDEAELGDEAFKQRMRDLVAPAEAVFLDAKLEAELVELPEDEALELLQSVGQDESGLHALARVGFDTLAAFAKFELDLLTRNEGAATGTLDVREVDKNIFAVFARDEAVALLIIEELHGTDCH